MNDLKHNIIKDTLGNNTPFWNPYAELNKARVPNNKEIQHYQLQKLQAFQKASINKNKQKTLAINKLFEDNSINTLQSEASQEQNLYLDKAITQIVENIADFRNLTKKDQMYNEQRYEQAQEKLKELSNLLKELKNKLNIDSIVFEKDLQQLNHLININSLKSFGQAEMRDWIKHLRQIQGELVEEVGTAWLSKRIPQELNVVGFSSGKMRYVGGKHGAAGSLIQDMLLLDVDKIMLEKDLQISYKIGSAENEIITCSLEEFFHNMKIYNGNEQIIVEDDLYDVLLDLSTLNIQAKSGKTQLPWNTGSKNTYVAIADYSPKDGLPLSVLHTFKLLQSLDAEQPKDQWVINESEDYNALANYGLGTVIAKTLHLSEFGNQYLLTPSGFITFPERIQQLFTTDEATLKIRGDIILNENTLSQMRAVTLSTNSYGTKNI